MQKIIFGSFLAFFILFTSCDMQPPPVSFGCERLNPCGIYSLDLNCNLATDHSTCSTLPHIGCSPNKELEHFEVEHFMVFDLPWSANISPYTIAEQDAYIAEARSIAENNAPICPPHNGRKIITNMHFVSDCIKTHSPPDDPVVTHYLEVEVTFACCSANKPS